MSAGIQSTSRTVKAEAALRIRPPEPHPPQARPVVASKRRLMPGSPAPTEQAGFAAPATSLGVLLLPSALLPKTAIKCRTHTILATTWRRHGACRPPCKYKRGEWQHCG
eukprot:UN1995